MSSRFFRSAASFLLFSLMLAGALCAQVAPRIAASPDNGALVRITGSTHALVGVAREIGRAPAGLLLERVLLQLTSSPEQETALEQMLADQQDPESPRYHAWLSPEQFGAQFGPMQQDVDAVTSWLASQGLQVTEVAAGRRSIEFSGTVQQVEGAFHTQINRYQWKGREHTANATDISIPAALAGVVAGVASLNDFGVRPFHHFISSPIAPQTDFNGGVHGLSPYDFAAIYNVAPLWTQGYDGTGQNIAIVGQTDIKLSDVAAFRATFGLPANAPTVVVNGKDPGIVPGDETEADLDVEWAGSVAKGAAITLVTSASTASSAGITLSAQYIVQHATAPVMSLSYGLCEAQLGASNSFYSSLWQQAAAEGIAVFVAIGDTGSAGCDAAYSTTGTGADNTAPASQGFGISGLASTPYNVAVGGTEFNDISSPSTYWNASNNAQEASAKGYIPEAAWNESSYAAGATGNSLYAGGGGASLIWNRPTWQTGPGVPAGTARLTPDVSLSAGGHDGYVIEQEGSLYLVGGTSAATPSFAGIMGIVNQYTHTANGNPASKFYALAASIPSIFHDVTAGTNAVPCAGGSANCSATAPSTNVGKMNGYSAGAGYDMATGLGTVDANALVTNWSGAPAAPGIVSLSPNPMTGSAVAQSLTINGAGFAAGTGLEATVGAVTYQGSSVNFVSSSQLVVSVTAGTSAQSLPVQVTLPGGKTTNSATLTITAAAVAPAISSLNPNPMTGSNSPQTLTINGSGFVAGAGLKVTVGSTVFQGTQIGVVSSSQLAVSVTAGIGAQSLAVQVTNPSGQISSPMSLTIIAAAVAPAISSLNPNPMTGSNSPQTLTINGSGFQSGLKLSIGGTLVTAAQLASLTPTELQLNVITTLSAHTYTVQVLNANGGVSNIVNLQVIAPLSPTVTSLTPTPLKHSTAAQVLTVNGTNFQSGAGLKVTLGGVSYSGSQVTFVSATQLKVTVVIPIASATLTVQVTSPSGVVSNAAPLMVN